MLLATYFRSKRKNSRFDHLVGRIRLYPGFYVDIGGYSPKRISNSYWFYKRGWGGIVVEPNPEACFWFKLLRPRDKFISAAITNTSQDMYYYSGGYEGTNFVSDEATNVKGHVRSHIPGYTLTQIFEKHLPDGQHIDFISIDCEGHDLNVLISNDWSRFRPEIVVAETTLISNVTDFMNHNNYNAVAHTFGSVLYRDMQHDSITEV